MERCSSETPRGQSWYVIGAHEERTLDRHADSLDSILRDIEEHVKTRLAMHVQSD